MLRYSATAYLAYSKNLGYLANGVRAFPAFPITDLPAVGVGVGGGGGSWGQVSHERTKANYCSCRRPCALKALTYDDQRFASSDLGRWMAALRGFHAMHLAVVDIQTLFRKNVSAQIYIEAN